MRVRTQQKEEKIIDKREDLKRGGDEGAKYMLTFALKKSSEMF